MTGGRVSIARHAACLTGRGVARRNSRPQSTSTSDADPAPGQLRPSFVKRGDAASPAHPEGRCRHGAIEVGFEG